MVVVTLICRDKAGYLKHSGGRACLVIQQASTDSLLCAKLVIKHLFQLIQKQFRLDFSSQLIRVAPI